MNQTEKTKRIAKNAVLLYIRMVVTLVITLFTSRIVLKALGFDDFGLYNVIGGVVTLFASASPPTFCWHWCCWCWPKRLVCGS